VTRDLYEVPRALLAEQAEYCRIKDLHGDDPRVIANVERLEAHAQRESDFAGRVRHALMAKSN
jgi:hypothetical protein